MKSTGVKFRVWRKQKVQDRETLVLGPCQLRIIWINWRIVMLGAEDLMEYDV